jgi:hypothetical protein
VQLSRFVIRFAFLSTTLHLAVGQTAKILAPPEEAMVLAARLGVAALLAAGNPAQAASW